MTWLDDSDQLHLTSEAFYSGYQFLILLQLTQEAAGTGGRLVT